MLTFIVALLTKLSMEIWNTITNTLALFHEAESIVETWIFRTGFQFRLARLPSKTCLIIKHKIPTLSTRIQQLFLLLLKEPLTSTTGAAIITNFVHTNTLILARVRSTLIHIDFTIDSRPSDSALTVKFMANPINTFAPIQAYILGCITHGNIFFTMPTWNIAKSL